MNRSERRAARKRAKHSANSDPARSEREAPAVADLMADARRSYRNGQVAQAHNICDLILQRYPDHVDALNLLGLLAQASGKHKLATKMFAKAIASDPLNAACHYNLAASWQALGRRDDAAEHFSKCLALGMIDRDVEALILQSPVITECVARIAEGKSAAVFGLHDIAAVADDVLLRCAMEAATIRGASLERLLTHLRFALLQLTMAKADSEPFDDKVVAFFCGLARQCFITEYVFAQGEEETRQAEQARNSLQQRLASAGDIPAALLAAVAAYFPLLSVPSAETLLKRDWPAPIAGLVRQQVVEPLQEREERKSIATLTAIADSVSLQVMQQYEENPYPRWTNVPLAVLAAHRQAASDAARQILVAGCGTGEHAFQTAVSNPNSDILAVDISLTSLAYAQRKSREGGVRNVQYAQADITELVSLGRTFDRIEAVGVLHHLADPKAGWRTLLSLLAPGGEMLVGLYSEIARRAVVKARALIAERGYRPTAEDIRTVRQEMIRTSGDGRWGHLTATTDFHNMSGCRDLLFNVMEHRFTIPQIMAFLSEQGLSFLGFTFVRGEEAQVLQRFNQQFPEPGAMLNLENWHVFEAAHPETFSSMYFFSVRKNQR